MARRRKTSLFDDLLTNAFLLFLWANLMIAMVSRCLLNGYIKNSIFLTKNYSAVVHPSYISINRDDLYAD